MIVTARSTLPELVCVSTIWLRPRRNRQGFVFIEGTSSQQADPKPGQI
jgi:hypothetical protein